ncbi:hypothetical protein M2169_004509 [Streptomyces sp. MJP52]|nr:hypothetical protein [Streptomyces sp. MJP52]
MPGLRLPHRRYGCPQTEPGGAGACGHPPAPRGAISSDAGKQGRGKRGPGENGAAASARAPGDAAARRLGGGGAQGFAGPPSWIPAMRDHSYGPVLTFAANSPSNSSWTVIPAFSTALRATS